VTRRKTLRYGVVLACGVLALAGLSAWAGEQKGDKGTSAPSGYWVKKDGELKINFADKETLKLVPHGDEGILVVRCTYTLAKGKIKAKISGLEGKAKEKVEKLLPIGTAFSFTWTAKGDTATIDNVTGADADQLRTHLEGAYEKK
jgi:hypothetical protein